MKFSNKIYNRLTIFNTFLLLMIFASVIIGMNLFKSVLSNEAVRNFANKEIEKVKIKLKGMASYDPEDYQDYPLYELKVKDEVMRQIQIQISGILERFKSSPRLQDEDKKWYPAKFYYKGEPYKVKIRFRGDVASHWDGPKKPMICKPFGVIFW